MKLDSVQNWLDRIQQMHPSEIELGLDRIKAVADKLEINSSLAKVITVAGTNGKGSTCAILESILQTAGYKTGKYASPHLIEFNERISIGSSPVSDELLLSAFSHIENARGDISLTYFEFTTLAAFWCFQQQKVDVWLLEVGLGGRLDATNIIDADIAIVTSIALDHQDWLGNDLVQIGYEKAGIFRQNRIAICSETENGQGVITQAKKLNCKTFQRNQHFGLNEFETSWGWWGLQIGKEDRVHLKSLPYPGLPITNAAAAIQALFQSGLNIKEAHIYQGLSAVSLPGRMQQLTYKGTLITLDVAHNPHAASYLVSELKKKDVIPDLVIIGMLSDKDVSGTIGELSHLEANKTYLISLPGERGQTAAQMAKYLPANLPVEHFDSLEIAIDRAVRTSKSLLICGSFVAVGQALQIIKG